MARFTESIVEEAAVASSEYRTHFAGASWVGEKSRYHSTSRISDNPIVDSARCHCLVTPCTTRTRSTRYVGNYATQPADGGTFVIPCHACPINHAV